MTIEKWLLTGGEGCIEPHVSDAFLTNGKDRVIDDCIYQGLEPGIKYLRTKNKKEVPLIGVDIRETVKILKQMPRRTI